MERWAFVAVLGLDAKWRMKTVLIAIWLIVWIAGFVWGGEQFKNPSGLFALCVFGIWFLGWIMVGVKFGDWWEERAGPDKEREQ
ncbi:MAG TPA: hypothetical protein VN950_10895 [Terriglobales bacterium]|nr:hypothetical protein [Terriglobales bacterium]